MWLLWTLAAHLGLEQRTLAWAAVPALGSALWARSAIRHNARATARFAPMEAAAALTGPGTEGLVYLDYLYNTASGKVGVPARGATPGAPQMETGERLRPLFGLYRETSADG